MCGNKTIEPPAPARPRGSHEERFAALRQDLHRQLIQSVDHAAMRSMDEAQLRRELRIGAEELCRSWPELIGPSERKRLIDEIVDETLGLGPLEALLRDETVSDILINGPKTVYIERNGQLSQTAIAFDSDEHLLTTIQKIVSRVGRRIDESSPMVDARLPDGSRVNAIIPPLALDGALVSIRRSRAAALTVEQYIRGGSATAEMMAFLAGCVQAKVNLVVAGGTGSGKTTLLNLLSQFIPDGDRIVTIEDAAELRLNQQHVARLETRPPNLEGQGQVTARDLLRNSLRMRPDRILIGECRGGEAFDMLQAMNTGHDGSLTTIHANSAEDALSRLQMLVGMSGFELPMQHIDRQISSAIQLVVQVARLDGGVRKITQIAEVVGMDDQGICTNDIFLFEQQGLDPRGAAVGRFRTTGIVPRILPRLCARGIGIASEIFARAKPDAQRGREGEQVV